MPAEAREPSPSEIIALMRQIRQTGVRAMFVEPRFNVRQLTQIANETGVRIVPLCSDALPADGSIRGYIPMMRANGRNIADALR